MKILYDYQAFLMQKIGGVSRYFGNLIDQIKCMHDNQVSLGIKYAENLYLNQGKNSIKNIKKSFFFDGRYEELFNGVEFRGKWKLYTLISNYGYLNRVNKAESSKFLRKGDYDIFQPTHYDPYFLKYLGKKPYIVTIHDMTHEIYPQYFSSRDPVFLNKRKVLKKAAGVITVSETTKKDLISLFDVSKEKITVVYHGSSINLKKTIPIKLPDNFLLYVGARFGYKNFNQFIGAVSKLLLKDNEFYVVCVGSHFSRSEEHYLNSCGIREQIIQLQVKDYELAYIYSKAKAFVFPSLYEGFGLPIIEAFSCGCPVVLSDIEVFREIAKDAALYFDPKSNDSIINSIKEIINNNELKEKIIENGKTRALDFSWRNSALETLKVYNKILDR